MSTLDRDDPRGLAHALAGVLKARILDGTLAPGDRVPTETELEAEFGVSRTVVREAVTRLRAAGLIETFQGRGSFVLSAPEPAAPADGFAIRDRGDLAHVMELRIGIEGEAAALAAARRSPDQLRSLTRALDAFTRASPQETVEADFAFHAAVATASGNPYLGQVLSMLGARSILLHRTLVAEGHDLTDAEHHHQLVYEHAAVRDAIARSDPDGARSAMRSHLLRSRSTLR